MNLKVSDYKTGDEKAILELFELVFKKPMSIEYWTWRFKDNPAGSHKIKLMWDNDLLVGHYAVSPVKMNIDGSEAGAALSMTTMTHPSYGGKGIFGDLAKALYADLEKTGVKMVWGFPNNNSHYGFIKNLSWKDIGILLPLALEYRKTDINPGSAIRIADSFTKEHGDLMDSLCSPFKVYTVRDADYLNWRYKYNPENDYTLFEYRNDSGILEAFIVSKKFSNKNEGINEIDIMEIGCINPLASLSILIEAACRHYEMETAKVNCWLNLYDNRFIGLEKLGFKLTGTPTYFGGRVLNGSSPDITYLNNWYLSFSDSDVY